MFQNVSNCTLNSCTMNEVSGHQENHFTTTNDSRTNCNNQRTVTTANSHNTPQKNALLEVPQADVPYEGLPQRNENGRSPAQ
ncbi:hypothetical protein BDN71DRAFT_228724 [Pleurotus eryngii]|uniref:Uncharacterized protein n=1 Tax=Pleurotus eryngii TaxID=5323 RepID=A0A9P6DIP0_PLEER|nr:hypothetical protein BDN71DRAFT_228724 [Pleurotus eryngii]